MCEQKTGCMKLVTQNEKLAYPFFATKSRQAQQAYVKFLLAGYLVSLKDVYSTPGMSLVAWIPIT